MNNEALINKQLIEDTLEYHSRGNFIGRILSLKKVLGNCDEIIETETKDEFEYLSLGKLLSQKTNFFRSNNQLLDTVPNSSLLLCIGVELFRKTESFILEELSKNRNLSKNIPIQIVELIQLRIRISLSPENKHFPIFENYDWLFKNAFKWYSEYLAEVLPILYRIDLEHYFSTSKKIIPIYLSDESAFVKAECKLLNLLALAAWKSYDYVLSETYIDKGLQLFDDKDSILSNPELFILLKVNKARLGIQLSVRNSWIETELVIIELLSKKINHFGIWYFFRRVLKVIKLSNNQQLYFEYDNQIFSLISSDTIPENYNLFGWEDLLLFFLKHGEELFNYKRFQEAIKWFEKGISILTNQNYNILNREQLTETFILNSAITKFKIEKNERIKKIEV